MSIFGMEFVQYNGCSFSTVATNCALEPGHQQSQCWLRTHAIPVDWSDVDAIDCHVFGKFTFVIAIRLSDFIVGVSNVTPRDQQPMDLKEWNLLKCAKRDAPVPAGVNLTLRCEEAVSGRYLVIQFVGKEEYLSLCEVAVETREYTTRKELG